MPELLDIYDDAGRHLGVKARPDVHRDGDWHRTFHLWICGRDAGGEFVILQRRGDDREFFPGLLDVAVAGHLAAGEDVSHGVREAEEELGLDIAFTALHRLGERLEVYRADGVVNREREHVYLVRDDRPVAGYAYNAREVDGVCRVPINHALGLFAGSRTEVTGDLYTHERGVEPLAIRRADFVLPQSPYWPAVLAAAQRHLRGEPDVAL